MLNSVWRITMTELIGDKLERTLKRLGVARVVEAIEKKTGKDCGCKKRRKKLNGLHERYLTSLGVPTAKEKDPE